MDSKSSKTEQKGKMKDQGQRGNDDSGLSDLLSEVVLEGPPSSPNQDTASADDGPRPGPGKSIRENLTTAKEPGLVHSPDNNSDDDEWEESYLYLDFVNIPSLNELFAIHPETFFSFTKRKRGDPMPNKPVHPSLLFKFHNFDSDEPVLQIGNRFFQGKLEEMFGTGLFLQEKVQSSLPPVGVHTQPGTSANANASTTAAGPAPTVTPKLKKLTSDLNLPPDPVFEKKLKSEYELVAKVDKVMKLTQIYPGDPNSETRFRQTPSGLPAFDNPLDTPTLSPETLIKRMKTLIAELDQVMDESNHTFKRPKTPPKKCSSKDVMPPGADKN